MTGANGDARLPRITVDWLLVPLLAMAAIIWVSWRFEWFPFYLNRGYSMLTATASLAIVTVLAFLWLFPPLVLRRRRQFRIFSLVMLILIVAMQCSWLAVETSRARSQRQVVEQIRKAGGHIRYDYEPPPQVAMSPPPTPPGPRWLRMLLGDDLFVSVTRVELTGSRIGDAELYKLGSLTALESLSLDETAVSDAGLVHLKGLTQLRGLGLRKTAVGDAGLEHLEGLSQLHGLDLGYTNVTDAGLQSLEGLTQLRVLSLDTTSVGDAGLQYLERLTQLQLLNLDGTKVGDAGLKYLKGLSRLRDLFLSGTKVGDAGLQHLRGLEQLGRIHLWGTDVTDAGVQALQQALPECTIRWNRKNGRSAGGRSGRFDP